MNRWVANCMNGETAQLHFAVKSRREHAKAAVFLRGTKLAEKSPRTNHQLITIRHSRTGTAPTIGCPSTSDWGGKGKANYENDHLRGGARNLVRAFCPCR